MEEINNSSSNGKAYTPQSPVEKEKDLTRPKNKPLTIVGMGGSAGSLDAIETFLESIPADSGIAFVLVQHQAPNQQSILPDLLRQSTQMPVHRIEDGMSVEPDQIYVIPENKELIIREGKLWLLEPEKPLGYRMPIDTFLQSLAEDWGEKAVCIIFSGMGADGELGARFIKEGFGLVIVQDPLTAIYDSMPRSTMQTGLVDFIETPDKIADRLMHFINSPLYESVPRDKSPDKKLAAAMQKIFALLRNKTGHDFSLYKKNTLSRRIERRMNLHQLEDIEAYISYLQENSQEVNTLFKELLIGVTKFFRDSQAFELLGEKLIPELLKRKNRNDPFRVWVAGCSTGEEAYSIAILLREAMGRLKTRHTVKTQIYATDLDPDAIRRARAGLYLENISGDMSVERLQKWFIKKDDHYQIVQEIREMVVFAEHNLVKDASFIKLDLLTCRNVLIYFTPELQKKLLPVFHYTLLNNGVLFLGPSETINGYEELFLPIDVKWKLFKKSENSINISRVIDFPTNASTVPRLNFSPPIDRTLHIKPPLPLAEIVKKVVIEKYAPAAVVINERGEILYISGHTGKYLEPAPGHPSIIIYDMAREGLAYELRTAVLKAVSQQEAVTMNEVKVKNNGYYICIRLTVEPLQRIEIKGLLLVVFEPLPEPKRKPRLSKLSKDNSTPSEKDLIIANLEKELRYIRENLQQTMEEMDTSYEELKSTNEELQSANEELQSTNEEANTAKEEMQALNEELMTVNMEFRVKTEELTEVNNDMTNLLNSSDVATIFVNNKMEIKRFTNRATKIVNLIQSDVGRSITHISSNLKYDRLAEDTKEVMEQLTGKELRVESRNGQWYLMKILPYRTLNNFIDGAVITFLEITALHKAEEELELNRLFLQQIMGLMKEAILILDKSLRIIAVNKAFLTIFRVGEEQVAGRYVYELGTGQWQIAPLRKLLEEVLPNKTPV
ncbi:PAS domain-containing protein [Rhodocytophaga rosea]|uniref:protein-glutamate O-methyltransferase n=1 Tax=Rhodocytophaga rosea TaxID=2704465 RepID=A0A6C0GQF5_9BACT|nr:CheR family methyltransferase [Rhodocytophaga rosea]QHT69843.1 PAS domain-containing protein [Rhodocytophaga rosea]